MSRAAAWTLLVALMAAGGALADEPRLSPLPPPAPLSSPADQSLNDVVKANAACRAFTNECEICTRGEGDALQCSTPGFACQPKAWRCEPGVPK